MLQYIKTIQATAVRKDIVIAILSFNAVTALGGGVGLMVGAIQPPPSWLQNTPFSNYFIPGLVLALLIGGSALLAAIAYAVDRAYAGVIALLSAAMLCLWTIDEIAFIQTYSWLQLLYFGLGSLVIGLTYTETKQLLIYRHKI